MSINFTGDVFPLYATNVVTDAEVIAVDPARRDAPFEQGLLTLLEVTRSFMAGLRDDDQARMLHYAMSRMMAGVSMSSYDEVTARVVSNDKSAFAGMASGDTMDITTVSGTDNIVLAAAPYANMNEVVADINGQIATAAEVEAYNADGYLAFRNSAGNEGVAFNLDIGAGPTYVMHKAGIAVGDYIGGVEKTANAARDDALAHFERNANPVTP